MLENIQSIIFDLDGTLVDSMWLWHDIDVEFLEQRGLTLPETYQYDIEGMSFTETAVYTKVLFHLKESVEELKSIWNQMAFDKYSHEVYFKPGAENSFSAHQEKEKRRLADYYISSYEQVLDNTYEIRSGYEGNVFANLPGRYGSAGNCTV